MVILGSSGSFWDPLAYFGGLGLLRGSRGTPCNQKMIFNGFGKVLPPPFAVLIFVHFRQDTSKVELQKRGFVSLVVNTFFSRKLSKNMLSKTFKM